ncbi:hypothetical protein DYB30_003024 [Aphanomyces astaci]|uniref:Uncharacterized protein n=1 Tax=Aphanomyces astaci TaxID=112090 RepID=A0A397DE66_APHAT|nr:hypothetical protein DYB30_003024 [Aphanomyces astaci]
MVKLQYSAQTTTTTSSTTTSSSRDSPSNKWQSYFRIESWLPLPASALKPECDPQPTAFTKEGDVDGWVFLGEETDPSHFTYADVASGKREQEAKDIQHVTKEYVCEHDFLDIHSSFKPASGMAAASSVLQSRELVTAVLAYQHGIYPDMRPFVGLKSPFQNQMSLRVVTVEGRHPTDVAFAAIHDVMAAWYASVGHSRVWKLFASLPHMRDILILDAVYSGDVSVLELLHASDAKLLQSMAHPLLDLAALNGQLDVLAFLHLVVGHTGCTSLAMDVAAQYGHLEVVRFLHDHRTEGCSVWAMNGAAENGHLEVVTFLHTHRAESSLEWALEYAAADGRLAVAMYLSEALGTDDECSTRAMDGAARNGHLAMVQYLHHKRHDGCTTGAMDWAAGYGHLEVVQWLHANRREGCTTSAMDMASAKGHLEVVQWLHEHRSEGCTTSAMDDAAANGHLEIVQWLDKHRREGATEWALTWAAERGHLEVVTFLVTHRHEGHVADALAMATNSTERGRGVQHVVAYLHSQVLPAP